MRRPTTLFLVRHGETPRPGYCNGHRNVDLTPAGMVEMEAMGRRLAGEGIASLYTSDLTRAVHASEIIGCALGLTPIVSARLREKSFGVWEGVSEEEIRARYPDEWKEWMSNPGDARPTGGETFREMAQRVLAELDGMLERHAGEKTAIVSHGGVNRVILCHALNLDLRHLHRLGQGHAALNIIEYSENEAVVRLMNGSLS